MTKITIKAVTGCLLCLSLAVPPGAHADDAQCDYRREWMSSACQRVMRVVHDGTWDLYVTGYGWHIDGYTNRDELNPWSWGGGIGKHWTDANGNEDSLFVLGFSDSHHNFQPIAGYARQWFTKPMLGSLQVGGGFSRASPRAAMSHITCRCRWHCLSRRCATGGHC